MKIINTTGIPDIIYKFLQNDFYDYRKDGNDFSATQLLKPVKEVVLTKRHWEEIEVEAEDRLWSLFGSGIHAILEKGNLSEQQEERLTVNVDGTNISGKFDIIFDGELNDFKTTSAWKIKFGETDEWKYQLSIYRWLYFKVYAKELPITGNIIAILRDWSRTNLNKDLSGKYPKAPVIKIPLQLMTFDETEKFVKEKIINILQSIGKSEEELPKCSDDERWWNEKQQKFLKCEKYCPASKFCSQHLTTPKVEKVIKLKVAKVKKVKKECEGCEANVETVNKQLKQYQKNKDCVMCRTCIVNGWDKKETI